MGNEAAKRKLNVLENYDADKIASYLHLVDVKGKVGSAMSCPVARYLGDGAKVNASEIVFGDGSKIVTPKTVAEFVRNFDGAKYPLVQE